MIVFCDGMPRSASTWAFNVVVNLSRLLSPKSQVYAGYHEDFASLLNSLGLEHDHIVVKSHQLDHVARTLNRTGAAKAIYTHRDPFDAIASFMAMFKRPFEEALTAIRESLRLYEFHRSTGSCCAVSYDAIMEEPRKSIEEVSAYLGLDAPGTVIEEVQRRTSFKLMKEAADLLVERPPDSLAGSGDLLYDHETLLHRRHIRDGRSGYGRQTLSLDQQNSVNEMLLEFALEPVSAGESGG